MTELTKHQIGILARHDIPITSVFDADGMKPRRYVPLMTEEEKLFVVGASPCYKCGPSVKTKAGHCIQCRPANVAFIRRHYSIGWVYIAGSRKGNVLKIGASSSPASRLSLLNQRGYGDIWDWKLLSRVKCSNAGSVEFNIHSRLSSYSVSHSYLREGYEVQCREIVSCRYATARQALEIAVGDSLRASIWEDEDADAY